MSTSRNAPCPCGSGKKYKQCCGSLVQEASASAAAPAVIDSEQLLREGWRLQSAGQLPQAVETYQKVLRAEPGNADAMNLLGLAASQGGRNDMAVPLLEQAIATRPGVAAYHNNLGNILRSLERTEEAAVRYREALSIDPAYAKAHNNLGVCLKELKQVEAAATHFRRAIELEPGFAEAVANLGNALRDENRLDEAVHYLEQSLKLRPDYANAHFNLSACLLGLGSLVKGWESYDWRFRKEDDPIPARYFPFPWWQGEDLAGKTLLIWGEQGVGDEIRAANVFADAILAAKRVIVECDARLVSLFARSFPQAEVVPRTNPPHPATQAADIDYQSPGGSLPRWYRPTLESFPQHQGFLVPDPDRVAFWKGWLETLGPGPKVGIAWRSMLSGLHRNPHYTALDQWGGVLSRRKPVFINLQYDDCYAELAAVRERFGVEIHMPPGLNLKDDLDEAAALTAALDLVITAGTSVGDMAGALGKATWRFTLNTVWIKLGTDHLPWTPSVTLYQKSWDEDWEPLLKRIGDDLEAWANGEMKA